MTQSEVMAVQGQSDATPDKQYGLDRVLSQWVTITKNVLKKHKWAGRSIHYVDMHAGSGYNYEVECEGSPVIAWNILQNSLEHLEDKRIDASAYFIEQNPLSCGALNDCIEDLVLSYLGGSGYESNFEELRVNDVVWEGDSSKLLFSNILSNIAKKQFGLIYFDPNGIKMNKDESVFDVARRACDEPKFKYTDILIRLSGTNYKRIRKAISKHPKLRDQLATINKKQWICRKIYVNEKGQRDPHQWTFLFGTNWSNYKAWESEGFYKIEDPRSDFRTIDNTKDELEGLD